MDLAESQQPPYLLGSQLRIAKSAEKGRGLYGPLQSELAKVLRP